MTSRKVGGAVIFSSNREACPHTLDEATGKVAKDSWGKCAICRQRAQRAGKQVILEGSQWCAQYCEREGPWACQEPATMEMVSAWRAWAVAQFATMDRDARWSDKHSVRWPIMGDSWVRSLHEGHSIKGRVIG